MSTETRIVIDFFVQTESGLKRDIRESGVDNIDPWEDMKEDVFFVEQYFLSHFPLNLINVIQSKIGTKYIARFLVSCEMTLPDFLSLHKKKLVELKVNGWAPHSFGGCPFKLAPYEKKDAKKIEAADCELKEIVKDGLLSFNQRTQFKQSISN
jgi:hypothetical protein